MGVSSGAEMDHRESSQKPGESSQKPGESSQKPGESSQKPGNRFTPASGPGNERVIGIVPVTTGPGPFAGAKNISLILTPERILCVRSDRLLIPHWWGYEQDNLLDHFRKLRPDAIMAEFPDTLGIPVHTIRSLLVRRELHLFMLTDDSQHNWHIVITTGSTAYEFFTAKRPHDLLDNPNVRKTLWGRLRQE